MTASLSIENSIKNLNNFVADIRSGANNYYYFIGGTLPWPVETQPPAANSSYDSMESVYHDVVCGKLITGSNVSPLIPYISWVANTVYQQYDQTQADMFSASFYVVTSDYSVYKCIDNHNGKQSVVQPSLKLTQGVFQTSDGYTWKFMFSIPSAANTLFSSSKFVPVVANTLVTTSAVPGTIDAFRINVGGSNYQAYHEGMIQNIISKNAVQLAPDAVTVDNFYTGSSLYLKTGLGAGQISNIVSYEGSSQIAYITPAFNTFLNIQLGSVLGTFNLGEIVTQDLNIVSYLYPTGWFNVGDSVIQCDSTANNTKIQGYVGSSNSSVMTLVNMNSNTTNFSITPAYPIFNTRNAGTLLTANVTITTGSNVMIGTSGNLMTQIAVNQFIRVGGDANSNIRRVTSITNSSYANVSVPFANSMVNKPIYKIIDAVEPVSEVKTQANGDISAININATILNYTNISTVGASFTLGELVKEYTPLGLDMNANGIISFVNNSVVILSSLNGTMTIGNKLVGQTSSLQGTISGVVSYPNITLTNVEGTFKTGYIIYARNAVGGSTANANPISLLTIPSDDVEYVVSPVATITGDGDGALAYCIVNNAIGSAYEITRVVPINVGNNYTYANVGITNPTLYGSGADISCVVSPAAGHGADPVVELGGRYLGVSMLFDTAINENYKLPNYGSYRRAGILLNPSYDDVFFSISPPLRNDLKIVSPIGVFSKNEIIFQQITSSLIAAGTIVSCNSSFIEVQNINGSFNSNTVVGNTQVLGLTSSAVANVTLITPNLFAVNNFQNQPIYDLTSNSSGTLTQVINSGLIRMTNVVGNFDLNDVIYDPAANSYAIINGISGANNTIALDNTFGNKFNQTSRIPLTSNVGTFIVGERVTQDISGGDGLIIDTTHELDMKYSLLSGSISTGILLNDTTTGGNGIVTFANSSYIRITGVKGSFNTSDSISCVSGTGTVSNTFPVIVLSDVLNQFSIGSQYIITGETSGAVGVNLILGTILYPDLTKNTGKVLYVNNMQPFSLSLTSTEIFRLVLSF